LKRNNIQAIYARAQFWFSLRSGGSVGHTLGVLKGFERSNIDIKVLSNESFFGIEDFKNEVLIPKIKKPQWIGELIYNLSASAWYRKKIKASKPSFIYHRYSGYTYFISRIASKLKIPLVLEFNSFDSWKLLYWERSRNPVKSFIQRVFLFRIVNRIEKFNLDKASLIVTVSEPLRKDLLAAGVDAKKILVNPNGYDSDRFKQEIVESDRSKNIRRKIGDDRTIIGFCGTFGPWHGIPQLEEAIYRILEAKAIKDAHFLIMGNGGHLKTDMEKRLSGFDEVTFTGNIDYNEINYYLGACDVLLSPHNPPVDNREFFGSPTKIFEYMGMGKSIIASDLGQIGKVLKNGKTAILFPPGDIGELIRNIISVASDKKKQKELGKNAAIAAASYTWDENVRKLVKRLRQSGIIK